MIATLESLLCWLRSVCATPLNLLISLHAGTQRQVHPWRCVETESLSHLNQVELVDIENRSQRMRSISLQVRPVSILRRLVEVVVLRNKLLKLTLNVDDLLAWEVELDDRNASLAEGREEADFGWLEEEEGTTLAVGTTGGTSDAVNVISWVIWWVELDDPVYVWDLR